MPKDFLSVLDLSPDDLRRLLDSASRLKAERAAGRPRASRPLDGLHVALLFEKPSLRTRTTFEIAVRELGGDVVSLPAEFADGTRETLPDVARNLERWVAALVMRTFAQAKAATMAAAAPRLRVINALSDEEHPCQALADVLTMRERWGTMSGRRLAYVGDGNNVATSLAQAALMMGVSVSIASPAGYELPSAVAEQAQRVATGGAGLAIVRDPAEAVAGADAVYTDVWTSMGQEREAATRRSAFDGFQVDGALMRRAAKDALFMHCLPAHRGDEVTSEVFDSPASVVFDQAENRLHTQKALLAKLFGD